MIPYLRLSTTAAFLLLVSACAALPLAPRVPALPQEARVHSSDYIVVTVRNEWQPQAERAGSTPRGYEQAGAYGVTAGASEAVHALEHAYGLSEVSSWPITTLRVHCVVFRLPSAMQRTALIARLSSDPRVESAQPLNEFAGQTVAASEAPAPAEPPRPIEGGAPSRPAWMPYNDPYAPLQRALRDLDVIEAHKESRGAGVRIAIIDTGVDLNHPDLQGRIIAHRNFVDADERQFLADRHGTEVAGVIAAVSNNGIGIVGIAPDAQLLAFKACWQPAEDATRAVCNSFTLAQGLEAAILAHADIVNLSLAGPPDPLLSSLVRDGQRRGILFTGAVPSAAVQGFPTAVPGVLAVESSEDGPWRAGDLLAPGREILTLTPGGHYDFASGSSLATAEISGILALMISQRGRLPAESVEQTLLSTAGDPAAAVHGTRGLVNACRALARMRGRLQCDPAPGSIAEHIETRSTEPR